MLQVENSNEEYYCPTGFVFLENTEYGDRSWKDCTKHYQELVQKLQNNGYIVQVAEPFDVYGKPFSNPLCLHLAIYIKRCDNTPVDRGHAFDVIMRN